MSKQRREKQQRGRGRESNFSTLIHGDTPIKPPSPKGELEPKTTAQRLYIDSMRSKQLTFGIGPAGVGKTYVAARIAAEMYLEKRISKIILTRPAVESGQSIGFLPGTLEEKMAPYIASYGPGFRDGFGAGHFEYLKEKGKIEIVPLNFMQGISWDDNVIVLFDEAENATPGEMKMFLTRIGERARVVIDGDPTQKMISGKSGLIDGLERVRYIGGVGIVEFKRSDIVRSGLVRAILDAYDDDTDVSDDSAQLPLPDFITHGPDRI